VTATPTPTPTSTATPTPTPTVTNTAVPTGIAGLGQACTSPSECLGNLFCVDGVCCNTPCDGPNEFCVAPGRVGLCSTLRTAPSGSWPGQTAAAGVLMTLAWFGLRALRRRG
jgi:hypothetical protein